MGKLSPLDAEFLDGMISSHENLRKAATAYIRKSDENANPQVVEMARNLIEQLNMADEMYREVRGHADGDGLRQDKEAAMEAVKVESAY